MFRNQNVSASEVLNTRDMNVRPGRDVTEIVGTFLTVAEAVVAHWVEYSKGLLLFVMVPGDERSGEFYVYDRQEGQLLAAELGRQRVRRVLKSRHAAENQRLSAVGFRRRSFPPPGGERVAATRFAIPGNGCKEYLCRKSCWQRPRWRPSTRGGS